ncbi:hypothetical protein PFISCL1PPCAC_11889, partial [Pristionchus fissidentatus]
MIDDIRHSKLVEYYMEDGDFYGLSRTTVKWILEQGRHCILRLKYASSLLRLKHDVEPIVVYVHFTPEQIIEWRKVPDASYEKFVHSLFENEEKERKSFEHAITHEISDGESFPDVVRKVIDICMQSRQLPVKPTKEETISIA